jgi:hypothetical protein
MKFHHWNFRERSSDKCASRARHLWQSIDQRENAYGFWQKWCALPFRKLKDSNENI